MYYQTTKNRHGFPIKFSILERVCWRIVPVNACTCRADTDMRKNNPYLDMRKNNPYLDMRKNNPYLDMRKDSDFNPNPVLKMLTVWIDRDIYIYIYIYIYI